MGNDGRVVFSRILIVPRTDYLVIIVIIRMRCMPVPVESSGTALHMILRAIIPSPSTTDGSATIQPCRVVFFHLLHPVITVTYPIACRLVTSCHHHKRRVMAIGVDNTFRLLQQVRVNLLPLTQFHTMIGPRRTLRLQIEAYLVGSGKGCLRGTIAMETHMVQTIRLTLPEYLQPRFLIHGGIACLGETAVLHRSAHPDRTAVDHDLPPINTDTTHTKRCLIVIMAHTHANTIKLREELIPDRHLLTQRHHERGLRFIDTGNNLSHHRIGFVVRHDYNMYGRIIRVVSIKTTRQV